MAINFTELRTGSVVRLASGSPKMSVTGVDGGGLVECLWWSDRLGVITDRFPAEILVYPRPAADVLEPGTEGAAE